MDNKAIDNLLAKRDGKVCWTGKLSSSALATAVAVFALKQVDSGKYAGQIQLGARWLTENVNDDGGWGDTIRSFSNVSTTLLCWSALNGESGAGVENIIAGCENWIADYCGSLNPDDIAKAVYERYDNDRTFSAPIMTVCAIAGRLGEGKAAWNYVTRLPFELSIFPHRMYSMLGLPVVSYALPALIAIGQVGHHFRPTNNPLLRIVRAASIGCSMKKLNKIQPSNGGFLEAVPLTAFVVSSLASKLKGADPFNSCVVEKGVDFILESQRPDGSFPIDTDLSVWLTTLSINALADSDNLGRLSTSEHHELAEWLIGCQYKDTHPYTNSPSGGWGWTNKPGSVPDADDTAGAILALCNLKGSDPVKTIKSIINGCRWLLGLQNRDGGMPTFCRGWGKLPFDRSCNDITAHTIAAWSRALEYINDDKLKLQIDEAIGMSLEFLRSQQNYRDGFWLPLWFGNQHTPDDSNPVYGTSRVIAGIRYAPEQYRYLVYPMLEKSAQWLADVLSDDKKVSDTFNSIEEVSLAIHAIQVALDTLPMEKEKKTQKLLDAIEKGRAYLADNQDMPASPIGFYFAKLWYFEELYPLVFQAAISADNY